MNRTRASETGAFGWRDQRNRMNPVLVGNAARAGEFIRDALNKKDHLDIVVIGDSNSAFEDGFGSRGYAGGFFDYIIGSGSYIYTTGQFYAAGTSSTFPTNGAPTSGTMYFQSSVVTKTSYTTPGVNGGYWYAGSVTGYPDEGSGTPGVDIPASYVRPYFYNQGTYKLELATEGTDPHAQCAYFHNTAGGTNSYAGTWIKLYQVDPTLVLAAKDAVTYRTYHGKIPGAGASAKYISWVYVNAGGGTTPAAQSAVAMTNTGTDTVIGYNDRDCADRSAETTTSIAATFSSSNATSGNTQTVGPMAVFFHTIFKKNSPGFGISIMQRSGGATTTKLVSAFGNKTVGCGLATQKLYLDCLRKTQIAAGGKGRVMIFLNMGTNGTANGALYAQDAALLISQLKTAWGQTGAPADDLVFVLTATAEWSGYNPASASAGAKALASTEANVVAYSLANDFGVNQESLSGALAYAGGVATPQAHLSIDGYYLIVEQLMLQLQTL